MSGCKATTQVGNTHVKVKEPPQTLPSVFSDGRFLCLHKVTRHLLAFLNKFITQCALLAHYSSVLPTF